MTLMQGLTPKDMKKHPALIPLFFCLGVGAAMATLYTLRLATKNPDVSWNPRKNPEPWNDYKEKQYKFMRPSNKDMKCVAPEY